MKTTKAQKAAKGQDCTLQIPGVCNGNPETTILAHVGRHGSAKRNHDEDAIFSCSDCHDAIDYRTTIFLSHNKKEQDLLRKDRKFFIDRALDRMQRSATRPAVRPQFFACTWKAIETLLYQQSEWLTECKVEHAFDMDGPEQSGFVFCPYCGGKIEVYEP